MPFEVYLSHAIRCWEAQEEWARQLSSRKQVWLTASLGIVGIGLLRLVLDSTRDGVAGLSESGPLTARLPVVGLGVGFLLVLGGVIILVGLVDPLLRLTLRTRRWLRGKLEWIRWTSGPSSALLLLPEEQDLEFRASLLSALSEGEAEGLAEEAGKQVLSDQIRYAAALRTADATADLLERNAFEDRRIKSARRLIVPGVVSVLLSVAVMEYTERAGGENATGEEQESPAPVQDGIGQRRDRGASDAGGLEDLGAAAGAVGRTP